MIRTFKGRQPNLHESVFVAGSAEVVGNVTVGEHSSIWFNVVVRGDIHYVRIGRYTNIQDNATVHVTRNVHPCIVGDFVTIGHGAVVHGCTVDSYVLIGMGAIVMDGATIGENSIIAAGAVVTPGTVIPPRSLVRGLPARVLREVAEDEIKLISNSADNYYHDKEAYMDAERG